MSSYLFNAGELGLHELCPCLGQLIGLARHVACHNIKEHLFLNEFAHEKYTYFKLKSVHFTCDDFPAENRRSVS
jgi:chromosome condensin MukBEF MukE localization factor